MSLPDWYENALVLLHLEHNYSPSDQPSALGGLDMEEMREVLDRVRPEVIEVTAKGAAGYVPYLSRYGNCLPLVADAGAQDVLALWRELTSHQHIRFVLGYSGLIDHRAASERPEWRRLSMRHDPYPNRALCPNSGYVDELMLPQLEELVEYYQPDGIWLDNDNWTVSPCHCSVCESEYQMLHGRMPPDNARDPFWPEWLQFHHDSFDRHLNRVARYLESRQPELILTSNGTGALHHPGAVPISIRRLTRDLSPAYSLKQAGLEARFLDGRGVPFDLGTWVTCSARPFPQGKTPALPTYPKTAAHLEQEAGAILASGGRVTLWLEPRPDDSLPQAELEVAEEAAAWIRERGEWSTRTTSAAYVAILHSEETHRKAGNGLYDPGPSLDRIRGAHQALTELRHPHDIVNEAGLLARLAEYQLVVLPEQVALSPRVEDALREWVRSGGKLLASGRVAPRLIEDLPTFALEEVLGIRWTGRQEPQSWTVLNGKPLKIGAPSYSVALIGAEMLAANLDPQRPTAGREMALPAATRYAYGEGEGYYLASDFFAAYHRHQYPGLRDFLGMILEKALPLPLLLTNAPPNIEVTARHGEGFLALHFLNHDPGKSLGQNSAFIERVPPNEPFTVTLTISLRPELVRLEPGARIVEWTWNAETMTAFIPPFDVHSVLVLTLPPVVAPAEPTVDAPAEPIVDAPAESTVEHVTADQDAPVPEDSQVPLTALPNEGEDPAAPPPA